MINNDDKIPTGTAENLEGKTFGQLTVLYRVKNEGKTRGAKWRCKCTCGNYVDVFASNLKKLHTQSCGCLQKKKTSEARFINETNKTYGRLTVLERDNDYITPSGNRSVMWKCLCECGNTTKVHADSLRRGLTTSCGCFHKEQVANRCNDKYLNKTFHYITVLDKLPEHRKSSNESLWKCKCNLCEKEFILPTGGLKTQISCGCLKDSYGVSVIKALLTNNKFLFETEKIFDTCIFEDSSKKARFDFFVNNSYVIEYDGEQHFSYSGGWNTKEQMLATQKRDEIKNRWCKNNNIPIIRIPYWEINNLTIDDLSLNSRFLLQQELEDE